MSICCVCRGRRVAGRISWSDRPVYVSAGGAELPVAGTITDAPCRACGATGLRSCCLVLAALARLDRDGGNLVAIAAMRASTGLPRAAFDHALALLRRRGTLSLTASDRRGDPEEEAGAVEDVDGRKLHYCSRR